ncbi:MAG: glycine cleavage system protein T, partial [Pirellulales bacterium]|nr:glycine cleavage system protein T [Pirellulales bacterium]
PREGYPIRVAGRVVGNVSSGTHSPTLGQPIAMGFVAQELASVGTEVLIDMRGREEAAQVVELPFYKRPGS